MKIAINAGHCPGLDSGAVGVYSQECDVVRDVASIVVDLLNETGHEAMFIQENELQDICDISNSFESDLFVSIHCNAANHIAEGTETFYSDGSEEGQELANCIQNRLVETMQSIDRGLKTARYYVLLYTDAPAVLVELDFIDNPDREDYLNNHQHDMAMAIYKGIADYIRG